MTLGKMISERSILGDLAKKIKIAEVKQSTVTQNLITIQVGLQNLTDKELNLNYKVEWLMGMG